MAGVSLIELMIAIAIGAILMIGLVQLFGASRAAYQLSEVPRHAQVALQEVHGETTVFLYAGHPFGKLIGRA